MWTKAALGLGFEPRLIWFIVLRFTEHVLGLAEGARSLYFDCIRPKTLRRIYVVFCNEGSLSHSSKATYWQVWEVPHVFFLWSHRGR